MNIFNIMGPVMIGPSSSHTGGAVRIGKVARTLLGEKPKKATILLHGSFAQTYKGHGTDKALAAGILGMLPDDAGIRTSLERCKSEGVELVFEPTHLNDAHPNTVVVTLVGESGKSVKLQGSSVGGGNIIINEINGHKVKFNAQSTTIIIPHSDKAGVIAAVTGTVADYHLNIANFMLSRSKKGGDAIMTLEIDGEASTEMTEKIKKIDHVRGCTVVAVV